MQIDKYKELFDCSADASLILLGDKFVDCNAATVKMLRLKDKQDVLDAHPAEISPERQLDGRLSHEKADEMIDIALRKGSHRFEWEHKRADGEVFPVEVLLTAVSNGKQRKLHAVVREISDRKLAEKEVLKMKNIESIGVLAGGIAHDFNNILTAILGNTSLALLDKDLSKNIRTLLLEVEKASVRAHKLTKQLMAFSKGGSPIRELSSLENIIKESAGFVLHGTSASCQYNIPQGLWLVNIDKGLIGQVIQNMVLNSGQAMPNGGVIDITCENTESGSVPFPHAETGTGYVKIVVHDNGTGIPEELIDKIFDPYFSTKQEGNGLGLATCYSIITKHGGNVFVNSSPNLGTSFTIYLPAIADPLTANTEPEKHQTVSQARILIMDDDEIVRGVVKETLTVLGHEVVLAEDGDEAFDLYKEALQSGNLIDLTIMDLIIPEGKGGEETVQEILKIDPTAKVVVVSGHSSDVVMENYKDYGFCAAMVKPYRLQELSKVIDRVLSQK